MGGAAPGWRRYPYRRPLFGSRRRPIVKSRSGSMRCVPAVAHGPPIDVAILNDRPICDISDHDARSPYTNAWLLPRRAGGDHRRGGLNVCETCRSNWPTSHSSPKASVASRAADSACPRRTRRPQGIWGKVRAKPRGSYHRRSIVRIRRWALVSSEISLEESRQTLIAVAESWRPL
jgi:hypothetical protein